MPQNRVTLIHSAERALNVFIILFFEEIENQSRNYNDKTNNI